MSDMISQNQDGKHEMFVAGEPAWHHLGQQVPQPVKWREAAKLANMTWAVNKEQLEFKGEKINAWGLFRGDDGRFLSSVGRVFEPIQWEKMFSFVDFILQAQDGSHYESAGILGNGDTGWCLARIPEDIRIAGTDDLTKTYFLFANYHIQGKAAIGKMCNVRVVCNNTLQAALQEGGHLIKISHTPTAEEKFKEAQELLIAARAQIKDMDGLMNALAKVQLDMPSIRQILSEIYPDIKTSVQQQSKARTVLELFEDNDNNAFPKQRGTAYNFLNAFTKYTDHFQVGLRVRDKEDEKKARARNAMFGLGESLKFQVLQTIVKVAHERNLAKFDTSIVTL